MDRRQALKRIIGGTAAVAAAPVVVSSTAFADGGSRPTCRPSPSASSTLTATTAGSKKDWILVRPLTGTVASTFAPATCPCGGTSTVQYRYELTSSLPSHVLYTTPSGGSPLSSAFSGPSTTTITPPPVYIRDINGTNLEADTYIVRLTVRYVCTDGGSVNWSCRAYTVSVAWVTGNGPNGTIVTQTPATVGPPDNSASCDSPAP